MRARACVVWSVYPCKVCIINSTAGLMGQLINGRLVYPTEWLISHLQQGPTRAAISSATARMITDTRPGWAAEEPEPTPSSPDSLTLIGEGAVSGCTGEAEGSFNT